MKRLCLVTAICIFLSLLSGCGSRDADTAAQESEFGSSAQSADEPVQEASTITETAEESYGTFSMPCNESYGWDPYNCVGMENIAVMQLIYEGLFIMNDEYDPEPVLANDVSVSQDNLIYTINLQNAAFSNGKALTSEDVVYSMQMAQQSDRYGSRFDDIEIYYALDSSTVVIELSTPNDRLPCLMDFPIIPNGSSTDAPLGTGPFLRNGNVLTLNSNWWQGTDSVSFQTVTLYESISAEDTRDSFEIDAVHFVYNNPSSSSAAYYHGNYELWTSGTTVMQYIGFNFSTGIFQDSDVRSAVTHAINRDQITETVYHNLADPAVLPVPPSCSLYNEDLAEQYAYTSVDSVRQDLLKTDSFYLPEGSLYSAPDEEEPEEDLEGDEMEDEMEDEPEESEESDEPEAEEETTYNNITMFVMEGNLNRLAAANLAAQDLTDAGFTVTVTTFPADEFEEALQSYSWDLYYGEVTLKPDFDLRSFLTYDGALNYGGFSGSDSLNNLISAAMENSGNCYELYETIMERGYLCPVLFLNNAVYTTRGVFSGLNPTPDSLFYQISDIYVGEP